MDLVYAAKIAVALLLLATAEAVITIYGLACLFECLAGNDEPSED